jgi:hypothetical protein
VHADSGHRTHRIAWSTERPLNEITSEWLSEPHLLLPDDRGVGCCCTLSSLSNSPYATVAMVYRVLRN